MNYWLMKSEPDAYSMEDLKKEPKKTEHWDGIRNYQARNFMRDDMKVGDLVLFYYSNCKVPGVQGVVQITKEAYVDHTAFDKKQKYYDAKSKKDKPTWLMVDVTYVCDFPDYVSLPDMREDAALDDMMILRKGNRLSITPVERKHFMRVCKLGGVKQKDLPSRK